MSYAGIGMQINFDNSRSNLSLHYITQQFPYSHLQLRLNLISFQHLNILHSRSPTKLPIYALNLRCRYFTKLLKIDITAKSSERSNFGSESVDPTIKFSVRSILCKLSFHKPSKTMLTATIWTNNKNFIIFIAVKDVPSVRIPVSNDSDASSGHIAGQFSIPCVRQHAQVSLNHSSYKNIAALASEDSKRVGVGISSVLGKVTKTPRTE